MGWDEWSARHVEREFVVPQKLRMKVDPKTQEEVQVEMSSEVPGQKRFRREREGVQKCTKRAIGNRWYVFNHSETMYADLLIGQVWRILAYVVSISDSIH